MKKIVLLFWVLCGLLSNAQNSQEYDKIDVVVIGGGASGTMAGIQSARLGVKTLIVEQGPWLGGMLTSAGVSAIDGNHNLHSGLWNEFRESLYDYYGGAEGVKTGWVSNVLFEPSVGADILEKMVSKEPNLKVLFQSKLTKLEKRSKGWMLYILTNGVEKKVAANVLIDGTELGDVAKMAGVDYSIGMDARQTTGEEIASTKGNDIIQDLTYVVILKDFGEGADKTIAMPKDYDPNPFYCTCKGRCDEDSVSRTLWECDHMMKYGGLPNNKVMINWPIYGNDYYLNIIELSEAERERQLEKAKWFTRCYIYYLQTELGFKNYGIAEGEFPTEDGFPMIPYHRESRRIKGKVLFTVNDLAKPFSQKNKLYRTGIAVGDYPIDHHHAAYHGDMDLPDLHFYPVPSYSLPLGTLIPETVEDLIVAEKSISVTNIVNGTTRLQPVCMLIGQAAGATAAIAVQKDTSPSGVNVRDIQSTLLDAQAYLMPYFDVHPTDKEFKAIQRIGATGFLKGEGKNISWQNLTLFYPDSVITKEAINSGLKDLKLDFCLANKNTGVSKAETVDVINAIRKCQQKSKLRLKNFEEYCKQQNYKGILSGDNITRRQFAFLLDYFCDPFHYWNIDIKGEFEMMK
ncbi:FAD-dependent oxidoreductase [Puteibacter caeruleilacunae]|nr:FAD-dependent oxidoreductase [Puteibacter caeruleilacunae]